MAQTDLTYGDLVKRYGADMAFDILLAAEKLTTIKADICCADEDARWQHALAALDETPKVA
jgi:hypothetical protein